MVRMKPQAPKPGPGETLVRKQKPAQEIIYTVKEGKNRLRIS